MPSFHSAGVSWNGMGWRQRVLGPLSLRDNDDGVLTEGMSLKPELLWMSGGHKGGRYGKITIAHSL